MADEKQMRLDGTVDENAETDGGDDDDDGLDDFGNELGKYDTKGGQDMYIMGSVLQKAVRRSNEEQAAWAAWELVRSGYSWWFWQRMKMIVIEEAVSEDQTIVLVDHLFDWIKSSKYSMESWEGTITAIRAALAAARMPKSREYAGADAWFTAIANEQSAAHEEGREPEFEWPDIPDEAYDKHTMAGRKQGRGFKHFMVHSGRLAGNTDIGREWKRKALENAEVAWPWDDSGTHDLTDEEIDLAVSDVEPCEHDERYHDQD